MTLLITQADGRKFNPATKEYVDETPVEETLPELPALETKPIRLEDLPAEPKQMNVLNAIITYELMGLPSSEICFALNCTQEQLETLRVSAAYEKLRSMLFHSVQIAMEGEARTLLSRDALTAARVLSGVLKSKNESNKLRAAEGILNRVGITDRDLTGGMGESLIIKIVKDVSTPLNITVG